MNIGAIKICFNYDDETEQCGVTGTVRIYTDGGHNHLFPKIDGMIFLEDRDMMRIKTSCFGTTEYTYIEMSRIITIKTEIKK